MLTSVPPIDIPQIIHKLERRDLDNVQAPTAPPIWGQLETVPFVRIRGQAAFWHDDPNPYYAQRFDDLVASAHGQRLELQFLIVGQARDYALFMALGGANGESILRSSLSAAYPGIQLAERAELSLGRTLENATMFTHRGRLTGIPTRKGEADAERYGKRTTGTRLGNALGGYQIERVLRGMAGEPWGYWLRAVPRAPQIVDTETYQCLDQIAAVSAHTKRQLQRLTQTMQQVDPRTQSGATESVSSELVNRQAEYAVTLLEAQLSRLDEGKAVGMWDVDSYFFAPHSETVRRAQALVQAVFSGINSTPQSLRAVPCSASTLSANSFTTALTSIELSTFTQLPREELPGYRITDYAHFDTDLESDTAKKRITLGKILDGNRDTGQLFSFPVEDLAKHGLIAGMTGSGKTTTTFNLLVSMWNDHKVPFMVVEPAKAEYRQLVKATMNGVPLIPALRVYTLGDESVAPLRLNPFEFEIWSSDHRIHVQTHIDYLKSVFNAAFILYAPMPYILEICLHEIYSDKGWDLTLGNNRRLNPNEWSNIRDYPIFPTLADLYAKIDIVTERLGYEERIEMDVKAGLKARVGSLMLGSKGLMLNCVHGTPNHDLLSIPTVLELERIGNDDEKAFVIGLVMMRIYEYRRLQSTKVSTISFQHLLVIEEAHRLLKNVSTHIETEASNVRGQAVETFANMLAEIRAYGQGILIAEQIPSKLMPDVIKNTNLKVVHRMVAQDEREILSGTMNVNESQERVMATLPVGQAIVYAEQADHPYLIVTRNVKSQWALSTVDDVVIRGGISGNVGTSYYDPVPEYSHYLPRQQHHIDTVVYDSAQQVIAGHDFHIIWAGFMLNLIREPRGVYQYSEPLKRYITQSVMLSDTGQLQTVLKAVYLIAATRKIEERGALFLWSYSVTETIRRHLIFGLMVSTEQQPLEAIKALSTFAQLYRENTTRQEGPFVGCVACRVRCWLRADVAAISEPVFRRDFLQVVQRSKDATSTWKAITDLTKDTAQRTFGHMPLPELGAVSVCILAHTLDQLEFNRVTQDYIARQTSSYWT